MSTTARGNLLGAKVPYRRLRPRNTKKAIPSALPPPRAKRRPRHVQKKDSHFEKMRSHLDSGRPLAELPSNPYGSEFPPVRHLMLLIISCYSHSSQATVNICGLMVPYNFHAKFQTSLLMKVCNSPSLALFDNKNARHATFAMERTLDEVKTALQVADARGPILSNNFIIRANSSDNHMTFEEAVRTTVRNPSSQVEIQGV